MKSRCWSALFDNLFLKLAVPYRQHQVDFIAAINDARVGNSTDSVETHMRECKVEGAEYEALKTRVLHLMPRHCDVLKHNR